MPHPVLTENAKVTDIVNFLPLCPTIQSGSLRFKSFKHIFMQLGLPFITNYSNYTNTYLHNLYKIKR